MLDSRKSMIAVLGLLIVLAVPAFSQDLRGKVQGTVTDASSAAVVGARITLRNTGTGVETNQLTNTAGQYLFDFVIPGTYSVTVAMDGFRQFVQQNVLVETRADISVNARLEVGAVAETINVTESPVAVKFHSTTMETTLDTKMSNTLPIIHRNPFLLLMVDPQVVYTSTSAERSPYHHWAGSRMDVGGGTQLKNDILVDGAPNTWGPKTNYVPTMDAVSELNVQQNATDAEFGHSAGGIVSLQMKSGSNDFHGSAYYFGRNPKLNAVPDSITHSPSVIRHNVWGVSSGNPIARNKVFNFFSYEGQNLREPETLQRTIVTPLERTGDFSQSINAQGGLRAIYDPWTTQFNQANNTSTRTPFPGNVIPQTRFDPTAKRILQDIWEPNGPGDNVTRVNNYRNTFPRVFKYWNLSNRTDWNVNENWRLFGRFSRFRTVQTTPDVTGSPAQPSSGSQRNSTQVVGDAVWTINPQTVLNLRGSYGKPVDRFEFPQGEIKSIGEFWPSNPGYFDAYAKDLPVLYYPGILIGGQFGRAGYWYSAPDFWNTSAKVSRNMGRHYVKVGGEFRDFRTNSTLPRPMDFRFTPNHTANTFINPNTGLSGDAWATFMLGALSSDSFVRTLPFIKAQSRYMGFYIQDDFKVNQRVTLNFGLRYEYDFSLTDRDQRFSRFLDLDNPIPEFQGAGAPVMPAQVRALGGPQPVFNGAWVFTDDQNPHFYHSPKLTLLPRFGVALRLNDRTALRFGYSRYVIPPSVNDVGGINLNDVVPYPGYSQDSFPLPVLQGVPQATMKDPFPKGVNDVIVPRGKSLGRYTELGQTGTSIYSLQDLKNAYNDRFNVTLQRQLWSQIVMDVTYFNSVGSNHYFVENINQVDPQFGYTHQSAVNQAVPNPFFNILTPDKFPGGLRNQASVSVNTLLRPYPQYGTLNVWNTPGLSRRYSALQLKFQRPFVNGFNFLAGYNYNRSRNGQFYDDLDNFNNHLTMQDSNNPRHKLSAAFIYDFPFGKGRRFMSSTNKAVDAVLGGWAVSGILEHISGEFLRFGPMLVNGDPRIDNPTRDRMFNTSVFTRQPAFTRRTNPLQFPGVHGPIYRNLDLTLAKVHQVTESVGMEIRVEAYNFTNSFMGANPNLSVDSSLFGRITSQRPAYYGRQIQYGARLRW